MLTPMSNYSVLLLCHAYLVSCSVVVLQGLDHVTLDILSLFQSEEISCDELSILVGLNTGGALHFGLLGCSFDLGGKSIHRSEVHLCTSQESSQHFSLFY